LLLLEVDALGLLDNIIAENMDCGDDEAEVDDEKNALLWRLVLVAFEFTLTLSSIGNGGNGGGDIDRVGGNSSYVNGGTLRCGDIFCIDEDIVAFECSSLWLNICLDGDTQVPFANGVWQ
jgi:hypothetical protein